MDFVLVWYNLVKLAFAFLTLLLLKGTSSVILAYAISLIKWNQYKQQPDFTQSGTQDEHW